MPRSWMRRGRWSTHSLVGAHPQDKVKSPGFGSENRAGIPIDEEVDRVVAVTAFTHFKGSLRHGQRSLTPQSQAQIHPDSIGAVESSISMARAKSISILDKESCPPRSLHREPLNGVFFDMVDEHPARNRFSVFQNIDNQPRAFEFIFEMRRMDRIG